MNRKKFIESQGATCKNWTWSWSFININKKIIIFGAWDVNTSGNTALILSDKWAVSDDGKKSKSYPQSKEHIRLILEENYELKTFPMEFSNKLQTVNGKGPAKIGKIIPELTAKTLKRIGDAWYASDDSFNEKLPEEVSKSELYPEGFSKIIAINSFERNKKARDECLKFHGFKCAVCDFDFEDKYGSLGRNYIHVHHVVPLSEIKQEYMLNPETDLSPVCPNCHAMIHNTSPILSIEELRRIINNK